MYTVQSLQQEIDRVRRLRPANATMDLKLGIFVESWEYEKLLVALQEALLKLQKQDAHHE